MADEYKPVELQAHDDFSQALAERKAEPPAPPLSLVKGSRVSFTRTHDRQHTLTGTIAEIRSGEILVSTEPSEVLVWARAEDVTVLSSPVATPAGE